MGSSDDAPLYNPYNRTVGPNSRRIDVEYPCSRIGSKKHLQSFRVLHGEATLLATRQQSSLPSRVTGSPTNTHDLYKK